MFESSMPKEAADAESITANRLFVTYILVRVTWSLVSFFFQYLLQQACPSLRVAGHMTHDSTLTRERKC